MRSTLWLVAVAALCAIPATAQVAAAPAGADPAIVSLTANASAQVENDRMDALLQVQVEKPTASAASAEVNARMAKALAQAKGVAGVTAKTVGYSSEPLYERGASSSSGPGKLRGWRVSQQLVLEASDFAAGAGLASKLQEDGLLLTSLDFRVSTETQRKAEARLQHDALVEWQARATAAAASMGFAEYRPGRLSVHAGGNFPQPIMRPQAMAMAASAPPVAVSGGSSELTVSGDAILVGAAKGEGRPKAALIPGQRNVP